MVKDSQSVPPRSVRFTDAKASLPTVAARGERLSFHEDFYHWVLCLSWTAFFAWVTVAYVATNAIFGAVYWLIPGGVTNAKDFFDCFCFSVETFATIGYGEMAPEGKAAHLVVAVEALLGILAVAVITGLTFARFARPQARILFSNKAVIANRNGQPHLMFRMANWRQNQIAEAQLSVMVLLTETTLEGETMRRPTELKLLRDKNPMFLLSWTAMHPIDESSPFYGKDAMAKLREMKAEIFLTLTGLDETLAQTIHTRYRYQLDDIQPNARFADVLTMRADGVREIDFDKFHDTVPVAERKGRP
ncbi:MAG: ATP-sensitive inward rectifier potassium channel 10 [Deltaproteobacteria bacterium]|nr:ATP-sensitive inward rectifier potassium channel 10 [Deltaproteobacteria bacterium]